MLADLRRFNKQLTFRGGLFVVALALAEGVNSVYFHAIVGVLVEDDTNNGRYLKVALLILILAKAKKYLFYLFSVHINRD